MVHVDMMPNKTLYVREEDVPVWEEAEKYAASGISPLVSNLLRDWVDHKRVDPGGMTKLVVECRNGKGEPTTRKAFKGRWLIKPANGVVAINDNDGVGRSGYVRTALALTANNKLAVYEFNYENSDGVATLEVFENFEEMQEATLDNTGYPRFAENELAAFAAALGEPFEVELDI